MSFDKWIFQLLTLLPAKGNDKHVRVNSVAPLFESGMIWAPDQKFAEEVIEECAAFPYGDHDDLVDSMTQAVMRFRQGGLIRHPEDYIDPKHYSPEDMSIIKWDTNYKRHGSSFKVDQDFEKIQDISRT